MTRKPPRLGLCPIGKFIFSHEDALRYKKLIEDKLDGWGISYTGIDGVVEDGMVRSQDDVERVVAHLAAEKVDGLFMPHCNFGTEGAAGMIARKLDVPVLLWGPRDEAPLEDGTRSRDSLCGVFATSKVLHRLGVPFTYIENCGVDAAPLEHGLKNFVRTISVVKGFRNMRVGQIGGRIDFFWTTIVNESELLEKMGIEVLPIDIMEFVENIKRRCAREKTKYSEELKDAKKNITFAGFEDEQVLLNLFAMRDEMLEKAMHENIDAYAVQSFMSICESLGCMVSYALAMVTDAGIPAVCETDIHGAISSVILQKASLDADATFFPDLTIRHPEDDNSVLLWHCSFPLSLKEESCRASVGPHWILPGIPSGSTHWKLKSGDITVLRFDGDRGEYRMIVGEGQTTEGPYTQNAYVWMKVRDWRKWERKFVEGPYIHHVACIYGKYLPIICEASRYLPGNIQLDLMDSSPEEARDSFFAPC